MTLILRKCKKDGHSRNGFYYGQVGERVNCPDWDPFPICGHGLHGLKEGNGDWFLLSGEDWLIIDADDQIVDIDSSKCKFNTGTILFRGTSEELSKTDFCHTMATTQYSALKWAEMIGNHDVMHTRIISEWAALDWLVKFNNYHNVMVSKINTSYYAYQCAMKIGNKDVMEPKITDKVYREILNLPPL